MKRCTISDFSAHSLESTETAGGVICEIEPAVVRAADHEHCGHIHGGYGKCLEVDCPCAAYQGLEDGMCGNCNHFFAAHSA